MEIKGSVVLVTGGGNGIGEAVAKYFAKQGAKIAIVDMVQKNIDRVVADLKAMGAEAIGVQANVTSEAETAKFIQATLAAFGQLNITVACAGIIRDGTMLTLDKETGKVSRKMGLDKWAPVIDVNLTGTFLMTQRVLPDMIAAGWGRIVNISSVVGTTGNPGQVNYAASKAGMVGLSKSLAAEVASRGITVNCVAPGFIETAMTDKLNEAQRTAILSVVPAGRMGTPQEIAAAVLFLASPEAAYVTGATLHVNGGMDMV